jgi:hypothetical protein
LAVAGGNQLCYASDLVVDVDVGAGTGIFTRQLRAALPDKIRIVGIEPSPAMRAQTVAETADDTGFAFSEGVSYQNICPSRAMRPGQSLRRPQRTVRPPGVLCGVNTQPSRAFRFKTVTGEQSEQPGK